MDIKLPDIYIFGSDFKVYPHLYVKKDFYSQRLITTSSVCLDI